MEAVPARLGDDYGDILRDVRAVGEVRVLAATWNQQGHAASGDLSALLPPNRFHIYAIGAQECGGSSGSSAVFASSKVRWEAQLVAAIGSEYDLLGAASLGASHLAVFVHRALRIVVTDCQMSTVACGFANMLTNKGAVLASLCVGNTSLLLVNAHLAAYQQQVAARNAGYHYIEAAAPLVPGLWQLETRLAIEEAARSRQGRAAYAPLSPPVAGGGEGGGAAATAQASSVGGPAAQERGSAAPLPRAASASRLVDEEEGEELAGEAASAPLPVAPETAVSARFDRVIWMGDLNYRINCSRAEADEALRADNLTFLHERDQLAAERRAGRAFESFFEGELAFRPTYKLEAGSALYDASAKQRVPAYTDRIMFKANVGARALRDGMRLLFYGSVPALDCSDHRPVAAGFAVSLRGGADPAAAEPEAGGLPLARRAPAASAPAVPPPTPTQHIASRWWRALCTCRRTRRSATVAPAGAAGALATAPPLSLKGSAPGAAEGMPL